MEKLKENQEIDIENLKFENDENLENKNEPKLLYRLDKRNPLCVAFDLFIYLLTCWIPIIFAIPNFVLDISIFSIILNIVCIYISLIVLQILYSVIFFDYIEIYEDKIIYRDIIGLKLLLHKNEYKDKSTSSTGRIFSEKIFIHKKRQNRVFEIIPYIVVASLTLKDSTIIENYIFKMQISKF